MIAIYNDFLRNKEYDEKIVEYNGNTVSNEEWQSYLPDEFGTNSDTKTCAQEEVKIILRITERNIKD